MTETALDSINGKISKFDFYFNTGLYDKIKIGDLDNDIFRGEVDGFSPENKIETTFIVQFRYDYSIDDDGIYKSSYSPHQYFDNIYDIQLKCKRKDEILDFFVYINSEEGYIEKIGQLPSFADMVTSKIDNKYSKILGKDWKNFNKSVGLFSHGIGIGSYVYLRRIFEDLIFETFNEHKKELEISKENFLKLHMDEKVKTLHEFLPPFLVKNKKIYSVLSIGLHELEESKCLRFFPVIRDSLLMILDQKIEIQEKVKKEKSLEIDFQEVLSDIKS